MTEEQQQALYDIENIGRREEITNNPLHGMSKVKYISGDVMTSHNNIDATRTGNGSMGHGSWVKWVTKIG